MKIEVYKSISEIGEERWSQFVSKRFFLSYNYLYTLEKACSQLDYRYTIYTLDGVFQGLCYFQLIPFSGNNLNQYLPENNRFLRYVFGTILSQINTNLLVLGNVIFTCENGVLLTSDALISAEEIVSSSLKVATSSAERNVMASMISENIKGLSSNIYCRNNFHEFKVEDRMEIDLGRFNDFAHYERELQSKYRVRMHKVIELNEQVETISITSDNFDLYRSQVNQLFMEVLTHSKFKLTTISVDYFSEFLKNVPRFQMLGYKRGEDLVGFVTYFKLDSIIEVHYIGFNYNYNHSNKLYNYILYDILKKAFEWNISKICYGRTAQELKSTLGATPFSTSSSLKLKNPLLNYLTPVFLGKMIPSAWVQRHPFKK